MPVVWIWLPEAAAASAAAAAPAALHFVSLFGCCVHFRTVHILYRNVFRQLFLLGVLVVHAAFCVRGVVHPRLDDGATPVARDDTLWDFGIVKQILGVEPFF